MFETLTPPKEDAILKLMALYRADDRPGKLDLGVGVYRDDQGRTPVMRSVKAAERKVHDAQDTKSYVALLGAPDFGDALRDLVLGDAVPADAVAVAATPGGTGALHMGFELIRKAAPGATVWLPRPTWPNHAAILKHLGMEMREYRYAAADGSLDFDGMLDDLGAAQPGDAVVLHGCCHNPTGVDPDAQMWGTIADLMNDRGLVPMVDLAYLGFGDGLVQDAEGLRLIARRCPEVLLGVSCSKNFGVYRDRVGALMSISHDTGRIDVVRGNMATLNRLNFSFPPDHGARVVTTVLTDADLRADWEAEVSEMRNRVNSLRAGLAAELQRQTNSDRFGMLMRQKGMFSKLGLSGAEVEALRNDHAVYAVGDSRINIAGLKLEEIPHLAQAIAAVI